MKRFIEGEDRGQGILLPELLDDYVAENNPVRFVDAFVDELDLSKLGLGGCSQQRPVVQPTIRRYCSNSTFMATASAPAEY